MSQPVITFFRLTEKEKLLTPKAAPPSPYVQPPEENDRAPVGPLSSKSAKDTPKVIILPSNADNLADHIEYTAQISSYSYAPSDSFSKIESSSVDSCFSGAGAKKAQDASYPESKGKAAESKADPNGTTGSSAHHTSPPKQSTPPAVGYAQPSGAKNTPPPNNDALRQEKDRRTAAKVLSDCKVKEPMSLFGIILFFVFSLGAVIGLIMVNEIGWAMIPVFFVLGAFVNLTDYISYGIKITGRTVKITIPKSKKNQTYALALNNQWIAYDIKDGYTFVCHATLPTTINLCTVTTLKKDGFTQKKSASAVIRKTFRPPH